MRVAQLLSEKVLALQISLLQVFHIAYFIHGEDGDTALINRLVLGIAVVEAERSFLDGLAVEQTFIVVKVIEGEVSDSELSLRIHLFTMTVVETGAEDAAATSLSWFVLRLTHLK